ncbi:MAG: hypothetical protein COB51_02475 [Moraxellaceae bacterium]|nr:MAG: hypothetical protein COB51_02475 [Moraxellaceae bacterium]
MLFRFKNTVLVGMSITLTLLAACSEEPVGDTETLRPVRYQAVERQLSNQQLSFTGVTQASIETGLSFRQGGTVISLNATPGERIKKGQLIAELDSRDVQLKYDQKSLSLEKAKVTEETASSKLTRVKSLYENNTVAIGEYESAKEQYANAHASYESEKRALGLTLRELSYYTLHSPVDGIVLASDVSINENIQAGEVIALIQTGNELVVEVGIPEQYITRAKAGQSATIQFSSIANTSFIGEITEVAYTISQESSTYPVTVRIENATSAIRPGMPALVSFPFDSSGNELQMIVPLHSVSKGAVDHYVLVVEASANLNEGVVHKRIVKIGKMTDAGFEILEGLTPGEKVITAGISSLNDGMKVRLLK